MPGVRTFDQHVERYEAWFEENQLVYESELRAIRELLPGTGTGLEIGVGSGRFAAPLGIQYGVEPSHAMRERARARGIRVINGGAEALPFGETEFDHALMVTTVCFLDDLDAAFSEAHRVLKPGGAFIIGFVDRESPLGTCYRERKDKSVFYKEATFSTVPELTTRLEKAGFHDLRFRQTIFQPIAQIRNLEQVKEGYGEGSFVVIRAVK